MTNIIYAIGTGAILGTCVLVGADISSETTIPIKLAAPMIIGCCTFMLWLDGKFGGIKKLYAKEHLNNKTFRIWATTSINMINKKLHIDTQPIPDEESTH